jgi:hypothetical protein
VRSPNALGSPSRYARYARYAREDATNYDISVAKMGSFSSISEKSSEYAHDSLAFTGISSGT